ncbi:hypothetical protein ABID23_001730, partial [Bartonella silvatica]
MAIEKKYEFIEQGGMLGQPAEFLHH